MPLLDLARSNREVVSQLNIQQVVSNAGDGKLKDGTLCVSELREYLSSVTVKKLKEYAMDCLDKSFSDSGLVLQDIVNELGKRLEYQVEHGLFQGRTNQIGFDGIWETPQEHGLVIEVKTTDAYRIQLDKIAEYRKKLIATGRLSDASSILIIVGRQDTGDLESQIRGSKHAWSTRLISVEAMLKLVELKENAEEEETLAKIRGLLMPVEYTRLDELVDIVFTTVQDVESTAQIEDTGLEEDLSDSDLEEKPKQNRTPLDILEKKRDSSIQAIESLWSVHLIKKSKAMFWDAKKENRVISTFSKRYNSKHNNYWFAFHPQWESFLKDAKNGCCVLTFGDREDIVCLPLSLIQQNKLLLNVTQGSTDKIYHHIQLIEDNNRLCWYLPKSQDKIDLEPYLL